MTLVSDNALGKAHHAAPDTSIAAAVDAIPITGPQRQRVFTLLQRHARGLTDAEIREHLPDIVYGAACARRKELVERGLVIDSGERRPNRSGHPAVVWRLKTGADVTPKTPEGAKDDARIPRERALAALQHIAAAVGLSIVERDSEAQLLSLTALEVVGSLRRGKAEVKDVDLLAPLQDEGIGDDVLYNKLANHFRTGQPAGLFDKPAPSLGRALVGLFPRFRECRLQLVLGKEPRFELKIEVWRYETGPRGNYGWIKLIRTGPGEFGTAALARWKAKTGGGYSTGGYPHLPDGTKVQVPTEEAAFELLGCKYIKPEDRNADCFSTRR